MSAESSIKSPSKGDTFVVVRPFVALKLSDRTKCELRMGDILCYNPRNGNVRASRLPENGLIFEVHKSLHLSFGTCLLISENDMQNILKK